jgi:hypothetical protein
MSDDLKRAIDQLANSLQTVTLLSSQLRRELGESAQRVVELETAADHAVRTIKRLQPSEKDPDGQGQMTFHYSTLGGGDGQARDASELIEIARRLPVWDEITIERQGAQFPRAGLSWHDGHGFVLQCFEDEQSWGFFLAKEATLSQPEVDIVLGGQVQERWPRQLFVARALADEALNHFLKAGTQKETLHWIRTDAFPRKTVWEGRAGREAWERSRGKGP